MINKNKLKGKIAEAGLSQGAFAQKIGMNTMTFYRKMQKGVFTNVEIEKMITTLNIDDPVGIFFTKVVS
jgi:DNA-binding XRE family transcriptional regulator